MRLIDEIAELLLKSLREAGITEKDLIAAKKKNANKNASTPGRKPTRDKRKKK